MRCYYRLILIAAALLFAFTPLISCSVKFSEVYYAEGDTAAGNMLIFSGDTGNQLTNGLVGKSSNAVVLISMGVTEEGTYTVSGETITFTFGEVTSTAVYDKTNDTITWYSVTYIKPAAETTEENIYY